MINNIYTPSDLNNYIKNIFDNDIVLTHIKIEGELLDVKKYPSGHIYFNIIDKQSSISAVMFSFANRSLKFTPKDGDKVIVEGSVNVYTKTGRYQVYVNQMSLSGEGERLLALLKLKAKLEKEGLFAPTHKRQINLYPKSIGIITARGSAAAQDFITNIFRRYPLVNIYMFYASVQGENAVKEITAALNKAYTYPLDTIIIGRGGGSNEDLNAFNDESLVRLAYKSPIPIIAAVGHEVDFTLIDFVADKRASTPTGASELATIDKREIYERLDEVSVRIKSNLENKINLYKEKIFYFKNHPFFINPLSIYTDELAKLQIIKENLNNKMKIYLLSKTSDLKGRSEKLEAINPKKVLSRGFALFQNKSGKIIKKVDEIKLNDEVITTLSDGIIYSKVINKEKNHGSK